MVFNRFMDQIDTTALAIVALVDLAVLIYLRCVIGRRQERVQRRVRRALKIALKA